MALGCEIQHRVWLVFLQQTGDQHAVANIALDENVVRIAFQGCQRVQVSRIGQCIEIDHADPTSHCLKNKVATNEAGTAGYKPSCQC